MSDAATSPKHPVRATRRAGRRMRSRLLDVAAPLFKARGLADVSIAEIAAIANAFPSQITYYFGTKEALFVEAACRDVLYLGRETEQAAASRATPEDYTRALVETAMGADALGFFVEALSLVRHRRDLAPLVERTIQRLHVEGLRAYAGTMAARGWRTRRDPAVTARRFWALAIGLTLEGQATGRALDELSAEMLRLLDTQADAGSPARLWLVGSGPPSSTETPA